MILERAPDRPAPKELREQFERKEISEANFLWLNGGEWTGKYLVPKNRRKAAHYWTGDDTLCRMWSGGDLTRSKYQVATTRDGKVICQICKGRLG
jgi:hypothetical protein